jgi:hypothetical protein
MQKSKVKGNGESAIMKNMEKNREKGRGEQRK